MYKEYDGHVEEIWYDVDHKQRVTLKLREIFPKYFEEFVKAQAGEIYIEKKIKMLESKFGIVNRYKKNTVDMTVRYQRLILNKIENFEKDRKKYIDLFDLELLEEYEDDPNAFKSDMLRQQCPIIHKTIESRNAKELDKYRYDFNISDANELLGVVRALAEYAHDYADGIEKDNISLDDYHPDMGVFDTDECSVDGVIGGGIKSMMLYKVYPYIFPSRSRNAIWAMWYLTDKRTFGCETDSEFLMIDTKEVTTSHNYHYPYELFVEYACEVYRLLEQKAKELDVTINSKYRYVIVDAFFDFVSSKHEKEISLLQSQIKEGVKDAYI